MNAVPESVRGVLVQDVSAGSVAYRDGVCPGEFILEINHTPLSSANQLISESNQIGSGDAVLLRVWKFGQISDILLNSATSAQTVVTPTPNPQDAAVSAALATLSQEAYAETAKLIDPQGNILVPVRKLGLTFRELTPDEAENFREHGVAGGALISEVSSRGPAYTAGLRRGDIITSFDGGDVYGADSLDIAVNQLADGKRARVAYVRDGTSRTTNIRVGVSTW